MFLKKTLKLYGFVYYELFIKIISLINLTFEKGNFNTAL